METSERTESTDAGASLAESEAPGAADVRAIVTRARRGRPPKNPRPDGAAVDAAPESAAASTAPLASTGDPPHVEWSPGAERRRHRKKKRSRTVSKRELKDRIRALRAQVPAAPAPRPPVDDSAEPAESAPAPAVDQTERKARLANGWGKAYVMGFAIVARRRGPHWSLDGDEQAALGEATADALLALEEIAPALARFVAVFEKVAPFLILGGVAMEVVGSRLDIDAKLAKGERLPVPTVHNGPAPAAVQVQAVVR